MTRNSYAQNVPSSCSLDTCTRVFVVRTTRCTCSGAVPFVYDVRKRDAAAARRGDLIFFYTHTYACTKKSVSFFVFENSRRSDLTRPPRPTQWTQRSQSRGQHVVFTHGRDSARPLPARSPYDERCRRYHIIRVRRTRI